MISLLEVAERAQRGPKVDEKAWDLGLFRRVSELLKRYEIHRPEGAGWFNQDDALVERAWQAALDLLSEGGVYCLSTGRVVEFTREEVLAAVRDAPREIVVGEGRDQRVLRQRAVEGREALNVCPGHHAPFTEDLADLLVKNFAQVPQADFLEGFNFPAVDGREIFGLPLEVYAARRQLAWLREGIRKAGRPGLAVVLYPISTRAAALVGALDAENGLRPTDGVLLSILPDLKMETDLLAAAIALEDYGCFRLSGSFGIAGGFCGGVEGAIVEGIAKPLAAMLVYHDYVSYTGVEHISTLSAQRMMLQPLGWARSVVSQALNSRSNTIGLAWVIPTSGPGTETNLLEVAVRAVEAPVNGANLYAPRHCRAELNAGQTPLEAEWMVEVAEAVRRAELDRPAAGELLARLAARLAGRTPESGKRIQECYDLVNHRPSPEYAAIHAAVRRELAGLGLPVG